MNFFSVSNLSFIILDIKCVLNIYKLCSSIEVLNIQIKVIELVVLGLEIKIPFINRPEKAKSLDLDHIIQLEVRQLLML